MRYNILPYVAVFLGWFSGNAQILDDSTKQVYGPSTISIVLEDYLKMNQDKKTALDTLLEGIEGFSNLDRTQWLYQDLGNIGTAMYPVYVDLPDQIGRRTGYQAYDRYTVQPESFQYFDTKSPFIDLRVIMGGHGRSLIDMGFTQNIVPTWNFGFSIHRMSIDKQIGAESNQLDRNVENSTFQMFSYYQ
ncbi:MAG: hypothetical protein OEY56_05870, partial [Cyclobacteriaceae bacterium]|nr:hypothetical protein [Cyclobacteriaceae bacterium]